MGDGKIGNGNDPAMPVDNTASVHLRKNGEVDRFSADDRLQKCLCFWTPWLIHFRCIDESQSNGDLDCSAAPRMIDASQEPIAVKHLNDGNAQHFDIRLFRCRQHRALLGIGWRWIELSPIELDVIPGGFGQRLAVDHPGGHFKIG